MKSQPPGVEPGLAEASAPAGGKGAPVATRKRRSRSEIQSRPSSSTFPSRPEGSLLLMFDDFFC